MRKTILTIILGLVLNAASSHAQSNVYSANIAGYVSLTNPAGAYVMLGNPLDNGTNDLAGLLASAPNGTVVQVFTGGTLQPSTKNKGTWSQNFIINPGDGFYVVSPITIDITQNLNLE
jgi:hypothetical protein